MRNTNKHTLSICRILLFCLVWFSYCFVISCDKSFFNPDEYCSVKITNPQNGAIFEEGDWIDFTAKIYHYIEHKGGTYFPRISMVKWISDKDGDLMTTIYDPEEVEVLHSFNSNSLSVNVHEIKCITFWKEDDNYTLQCSDSILININEKTPDTTTTTTMIDLSLFNHAKITLRTVKENRTSYEAPIEDHSTDVLSDRGHEGSFSGFEYFVEWLDPVDAVTNVEMSGSIAVTLSSVENAVTYAKYHREEDDLDEDNVYNYTIDFETTNDSGIPLINSSTTSLIFRVNGFEVCDYIESYETIKVMNETTTVTRTHRYCDENSVLEIYFYH